MFLLIPVLALSRAELLYTEVLESGDQRFETAKERFARDAEADQIIGLWAHNSKIGK